MNSPNDIFEVYDLRLDHRFHNNPLVINDPHVVFYTGVPLVSSEGNAFGTLCVIDIKPKRLNDFQKKALETLSKQVVKSLELRKKNLEIETQNELLKEKNRVLKDLAHVISHDLKSPLNNIIGLSEIIANPVKIDPEEAEKLNNLIYQTANNLKVLIDDVISYALSENKFEEINKTVSLSEIIEECLSHFNHLKDTEFAVDLKCKTVIGNPSIWKQIIFNLVSNAVQYNDKPQVSIHISSFSSSDTSLHFVVKDNGPGIAEHLRHDLFKPFKTLKAKTRNGEKPSGLGLAIVDKLVAGLNGSIDIQSNDPCGAVFTVSIPASQG